MGSSIAFCKAILIRGTFHGGGFSSSNVRGGCRGKMTSVQYVEQRTRDPTFEKFMDKHKKLITVRKVQDIILGSRDRTLSVEYLARLRYKLRLKRGAEAFLRKYPHIFEAYKHPTKWEPWCRLTDKAQDIVDLEDKAIRQSEAVVLERLKKLGMMSASGTLPLRSIYKVSRELGLPDDFEESIILKYPQYFRLIRTQTCNDMVEFESREPSLAVPAVERWRNAENSDECLTESNVRFGFKHEYPPGFKISKGYRAKAGAWQKLRYESPYEDVGAVRVGSRGGLRRLEKRAVAILHEFLSLTVEKMVEVERVSHFRKAYNIDLNVRDLFLDHPGMFYLSTKGKVHTIFLREAYRRGNLIEPNPVYAARRKMLDLVVLGRRGAADLLCQSARKRAAGFECSVNDCGGVSHVGNEGSVNALQSGCGDLGFSDPSDSSEDEEWDFESDASDSSE